MPSVRGGTAIVGLLVVGAVGCSPAPVSTTRLTVTGAPTPGATDPGQASTSSSPTASPATSSAIVASRRRPVLSLAPPAGWQQMTAAQLGQAWVGVRSTALKTEGYQPNVLASALITDQAYRDLAGKPVMCQQPTAFPGVTRVTVLGHRLEDFRGVQSCVSDAEYTISSGLRVHELNVVFTAEDHEGTAVLVQLVGRAPQAAWASVKPQVQAVMESLTVTP